MPNPNQNHHPDTDRVARDIHDVAAHFAYAQPQNGGYRLRCEVPGHDDKQASVMLNPGRNGNLVLHCHAGCDTRDVLAAVGLTLADLRGEAPSATITPIRAGVVASYDYVDLHGEVVRTKVKALKADGTKTFWWQPRGSNDLLYRFPDVRAGIEAGQTIHITEGEKDADTLASFGYVATTAGGAGTWSPVFTGQLRGAQDIVVVADDDKPGREHAVKLADILLAAGHDVQVVYPMRGFKDVTEVVEAGHGPLEGARWQGGEPEGMVVRMSDVPMSPARWAWKRHFALGAISYIEGDPGVSKSTVTCDLAARWTTGRDMPDGSPNEFGGAVTVAMLTAEDSLEHTMGPRLYAAGADPAKVLAITSGPDGEPFSINAAGHLAALRLSLKHGEARILIIDPLPAFLGETDTFKDSSVRAAMLPLAMLAHELDLAILVVRHFNKSTGGKAIHKGGGSIGFAGAARAVFQVSRHPDVEDQFILTNAKNNLARLQTSLTYVLIQDHRVREVDPEFEIARIEWRGTSEMGAQDVLDAVVDVRSKEFGDVLLEAVSGGPKTWKTISEILDRHGYSARTAENYRNKYLERFCGPNGNRDSMWRARGSSATPAKKQRKAAAKPKPKAAPNPTPESRCESCGRGPAIYLPTPVAEFRCQDHAAGVLQ